MPGAFRDLTVSVTCVDYMNELLVHNMSKVAVQTSKSGDQLVQTIVGNLPVAPLNTSYAAGPDTFAYALQDIKDENTSGMNAVQRVDQSGLSYSFIKGDVSPQINGGETLTWHSRNTRFGLSSAATFDNTMSDLRVNRKADSVYNNIAATGYPVKLGTSNEVLWTQQKELVIGPAQTMVVEARFTDPSGAGQRVAVKPGSEVTPVADTDYKMSSVSGSGNDKNAKLTLVVTWGGNLASISLTNTDAGTCYINTLQLRGKIIRLYDPSLVRSIDAASQAQYGDRVLSVAFPYQDNLHAITAFSTGLLGRLKDPHSTVDSLEFAANATDADLTAALACDVGVRITASESVTGFVTQDFAVGTYELTVDRGELTCKLGNLENSAVWNDIGTWEEDPAPGGGAAFDAVTNISGGVSTGTSFSTTHTPVGTPSLIVVGVAFTGSRNVWPTVTYGGVPMSMATSRDSYPENSNLLIYYLFSPPPECKPFQLPGPGIIYTKPAYHPIRVQAPSMRVRMALQPPTRPASV